MENGISYMNFTKPMARITKLLRLGMLYTYKMILFVHDVYDGN